MAEISSIEPNLDLIEHEGRKFYLLGTAHVSQASVDLVREAIDRYSPDTVCVELCQARFESLQNPERWKETDIFEVVKEGRWYVLLTQLALAGFQKKLGNELQIKPGEEMSAAIEAAQTLGKEVSLVDRDVKITLKRAWAKASLWSMVKISGSMLASLFVAEKITEEDIEKLKEGDALLSVISEFESFLPGIKDALISERDKYMAEKILRSPGKTVVAVLGAGHIPGIKEFFGKPTDIAPLEQIPPPKRTLRLLSWGIPILVVLLVAYGFFVSGKETSYEMIKVWILVNGSLSALGAAIALAHPLTIATAFIAAPITSLNPTIAAGWACGLVEALLRKPRVKDLENIGEDIISLQGFWQNRVTKVLLVIAFANIGSMLGTAISVGAFAWLL